MRITQEMSAKNALRCTGKAWLLLGGMFFISALHALAQAPVGQRSTLRYEIDAKRIGVDVNSEDALPRSREFLRIDSTYYVGWMFEGAYKYNHAADYLGYKNAALPLARALYTLERDFGNALKTRTADVMVYFPIYKYQLDYTLIAYYLMNCYSNMEEPEQVFALLRRVLQYRLQRDYYLDAYNYLGWTVHRNRYYTQAQYSFLQHSIDANEALAMRYLDSGLQKISRDYPLNSRLFQPGYEQADKLAVYHYKAILYSYSFQIDSAARYYQLMRDAGRLPYNNFATFRVICGDFRAADAAYQKAGEQDGYDKRLQEWVYYSSVLDIYKGLPKAGVQLTKDMIKANGSTPGFGWYNIALARCLLYDGQRKEAARYTEKAAQFKETHIGTTLGQTHYSFSIQLLKLQQKIQEIEAQKWEHANWWYHPMVWAKIAQLTTEKYVQQFLIIQQFAQNPERDRVIYKLFSTESTVTWDEVWLLIRDFSTSFFYERFKKQLAEDKRTSIHKYYEYVLGNLLMKKGDYPQAMRYFDKVLAHPELDKDYEKLLLARTLLAKATCAQALDDDRGYRQYLYDAYCQYPQLIPYSGLRMSLQLRMGNAPEGFIAALKKLHIDWESNSQNAPIAHIQFVGSGQSLRIAFSVTDSNGKAIIAPQTMPYKQLETTATELAYRLFGIGGGTQPEAERQAPSGSAK